MANNITKVNYPVMVQLNEQLPKSEQHADGLKRVNEAIEMIRETKLGDEKSELTTKHWLGTHGIFIPYDSWMDVKLTPDIDLQRGKTLEMNSVKEAQAFVDDPKNHHI